MPTCTYCGEDHLTSACVKRSQDQATHAIEKMGYQKLSEMEKFASTQRASLELVSSGFDRMSDRVTQSMSSGFDRMSDRVTQSIGETTDAIRALTDIYEFNHSEMMWQMDRQFDVLTGIDDKLTKQMALRANEALGEGVRCLEVGDFEGSIRKLREAEEARPSDYRIYIAMGYFYLKTDDLKNALDRFEYALKHARTDYYKSYSLLLISRVYYCMGNLKMAVEKAKRTVEQFPDYPEAYYWYAAYVAQNRHKRLTG